jgi:hypothetical protein
MCTLILHYNDVLSYTLECSHVYINITFVDDVLMRFRNTVHHVTAFTHIEVVHVWKIPRGSTFPGPTVLPLRTPVKIFAYDRPLDYHIVKSSDWQCQVTLTLWLVQWFWWEATPSTWLKQTYKIAGRCHPLGRGLDLRIGSETLLEQQFRHNSYCSGDSAFDIIILILWETFYQNHQFMAETVWEILQQQQQ